MSCPTCSATMQNLGSEGRRIFWCPRCGTLREYTGDFHRDELPIWLRRIVDLSGIGPGKPNESQHCSTQILFKVDRFDEESPRIEFRGDERGRT